MIKLFRSYRNLESHIFNAIVAQAFIQLINASFMIALLIYMDKCGYEDHEATEFFKYRFLGVLALAYPMGRFIRGRKIIPFFYIACLGVPAAAFIIIYAIELHWNNLLYAAQISWGVCFMFLQVNMLPYIMRNARKDTHTEAISLSYSTWSFTTIIAGVLIFSLQAINPNLFDEKLLLQLFSGLSLLSIVFILRIRKPEELNKPQSGIKSRYDWGTIAKALIPTLIIAIGAGLTIPFISLFFYNVHGLDTDAVSLVSAGATVIVFFMVMLVPAIKRKLGYKKAIPLTQSLAVLMLIGLASTQWYAGLTFAAALAVLFYTLRQPLMNVAGPMTSELTMNYVGKKNQEMVSALTASIWSGSWFISSIVFQVLRSYKVDYVNIFLITAGLYAVGIITYYLLILDYEKRRDAGLAEPLD